jgi:hypothetical protein
MRLLNVAADKDEKQRNNSDKRLENLKPFESGKSGNPAGRARGSVNITSAIKRVLKDYKEVSPGDKRKYVDILAQSLVVNAIKGNGTAIKQILDRVDGVVAEKHEHTGKDGGPLDVLITVNGSEFKDDSPGD